MFNKMKIGLRLALAFCLLIGFMIAIIVVSINRMADSRDKLDYIVKVSNLRLQLANNMIDNARETAVTVRSIVMANVINMSDVDIQRFRDGLVENRKSYSQNIANVRKLISGEDTEGFNLINQVEASGENARNYQDKVIETALAGKTGEATNSIFGTAYPSVKQWIKDSQDFIKHNEQRIAFRYDEAVKAQQSAYVTMLILGSMSITIALVIAIFLTLSIIKPLKFAVLTANMIAAKDLTPDLSIYKKRGDEVGMMMQAFGAMVEALQGQVGEIQEGVNTLSSSSSEILAATEQVASGTSETATAISETTTTVEEVRQAAQLSSRKAQNLSENAEKVVQVSRAGQKSVEETAAGMRNIRNQMESIANTIVRLSEQGQSIGGIIATVTDLADQSNLLAVNAAIEAAGAGEPGKRFAVVAQEIRSLAEQSKQATARVRDILNDLQKATSAAVMATEQGNKAVDAGVKQSAQAGDAIMALSKSTEDTVQAAIQIVTSSRQQEVGMDQIGAAMENINQAGAETVASMRQTEEAAKNLHELGQRLKEMVEQFKV